MKTVMRILRSHAYTPALLAMIIICIATLYADSQNRLIHRQTMRAEVVDHLNIARTRLEGNVNSNLQLIRGLVAAISADPTLSRERFEKLAKHIFDEKNQIRNVAIAPDLIIRYNFPLKGNEKTIGVDYRTMESQRAAAYRARDTGQLVLAGPLTLIQGGQGLIGRFPVFVDDGTKKGHFWGLIAAVIDVEKLYRESGFYDFGRTIDFAIRGKDGLGETGASFFGDSAIFDQDPILAKVTLPGGTWQIAAIPKGGWQTTPDNNSYIRIASLLAAILIFVPLVVLGRLVEERRQHIAELRVSEYKLENLAGRLELALESSNTGVWDYDPQTGEMWWDSRMHELYTVAPQINANQLEIWTNALHPEDRPRVLEEFRQSVLRNGRFTSTHRIVVGGREIRHLRAQGTAYQDARGGRRIAGLTWDITDDIIKNADLVRAQADHGRAQP